MQKVREQVRAALRGAAGRGPGGHGAGAVRPPVEELSPAEQARVIGLLVKRVDYDGARGKLSITFQPTGIKALADELAGRAGGTKRMRRR